MHSNQVTRGKRTRSYDDKFLFAFAFDGRASERNWRTSRQLATRRNAVKLRQTLETVKFALSFVNSLQEARSRDNSIPFGLVKKLSDDN